MNDDLGTFEAKPFRLYHSSELIFTDYDTDHEKNILIFLFYFLILLKVVSSFNNK